MATPDPNAPLAGWQVLVLRPAAGSRALRERLARLGARVVPVPALRIAAAEDPRAADAVLAQALAAPLVLFTSPAAVAAARRLPAWRSGPAGTVLAVGPGTARSLARAGVAGARVPASSDSEGLLAMPELQALAGTAVGLVTAPGGRGLLAPALAARGAELRRADVYRRLPPRFDRRHRAALATLGPRVALLLSSAEALDHFRAGLAPEATAVLGRAEVVAASARLAARAREAGAHRIRVAASAAPADLVAALLGA